MREVHDHYFRQAKREGYRSRAAYKLLEIDDRKRIFSKGDAVLDCGAAPGSWLQVAAERVGPGGIVIGVDLKPIEPGLGRHSDRIATVQGDVQEIEPATLLAMHGRGGTTLFDAVISDIAPGTTGDPKRDHLISARLCNALLDRLPSLLRAGGNFVMKVFEGAEYPAVMERAKAMFQSCKGFKPKASRSESVEMFIVCHGFRGETGTERNADDDAQAPPRRRKPSGW